MNCSSKINNITARDSHSKKIANTNTTKFHVRQFVFIGSHDTFYALYTHTNPCWFSPVLLLHINDDQKAGGNVIFIILLLEKTPIYLVIDRSSTSNKPLLADIYRFTAPTLFSLYNVATHSHHLPFGPDIRPSRIVHLYVMSKRWAGVSVSKSNSVQ